MNKTIRILHLEDQRSDALLVKQELQKAGLQFELLWVENKTDFEKGLNEFFPDIILSDHDLPSFSSLHALEMLNASALIIPFILITATLSEKLAVVLMKGGISDYILKDRMQRLPIAIINSLEKSETVKQKQKYLDKITRNEKRFRAMIEKNADMITLALPEGKILYVSPSLTNILGFTKEEYLSRPSFEFIYPDDIPSLIERLKEIMDAPGKSFYGQHRLLHKNGTYVWCEGTITNMLHDPDIGALVSNFRDITDRKNAEDGLNKALQRLTQAQETAQVGSWELTISSGIGIWSDEACKIYGIPGDNIQSHDDWVSFIHPEDLGNVKKEVERAWESFTDSSFEHRIIRKDGTIRHIHSQSRFELNENGEPISLTGICHDVTERKKSELTIRESEKRYRNIVETAQEGIWAVDKHQNTNFANKKICEMLECTPEEMMGKPLFDFMDEEGKAIALDILESQKTQAKPTFEFKFITKSKREIWTSISSSPIFSDEGEYSGSMAMVTEITERMEDEKKLVALSQRLLLATDSANIGIFDWDMVSNKLIWDANMYALYGITADNKDNPIEISDNALYPDDKIELANNLEEAIKLKNEFHAIFRIVWPNKDVRYTEAHAFILKDDKGIPLRMIGVNWDITKQKSAEEKIITSEKRIRSFAKHLNFVQEKERAHIAREIHDELGQQLAGIKMHLSLWMKLKETTLLEDNIKSMISDVDAAIQSMRKIATDLRPGILDSLGLIPSIEWLGSEFERKTGIKCEVKINVREQQFEKNISICVFRICQETLTNITKHAEATGVIILMSYIKNSLTLSISDNGEGIASEKLNNPFSMGLLGMRERASNIGGDLQIISKKGEGTTIQLKAKL
jgi:PAS domain S-box-containing protein